MRGVVLAGLFLCWSLAAGKPDYALIQARLTANRAKWNAQRIVDYEMTISRQCFCVRDAIGPFDVTVRRGDVVRVIPKNQFSQDLTTVQGLFDFVQEAIQQKAARMTVSYDSELGYPANVFVDRDEGIADEEEGFEAKVTDFKRGVRPVTSPRAQGNGFNPTKHKFQLRKWKLQNLTHYTYRLERLCFCAAAFRGPFVVTVDKGEVTDVVLEESPDKEIPAEIRKNIPTISGLFRVIATEAQKAASVEISYDLRRGYPTRAVIDRIKQAIDDEITYKAELLSA